MTKQDTKIHWLTIGGKPMPIWLPSGQPNHVEIKKDCFQLMYNGYPVIIDKWLKHFSPLQIDNTITRYCPECGGTGHILETTKCPRIYNDSPCVGQIQYKLKSVELKQYKDTLQYHDEYVRGTLIEGVSHDTWLCVGEIDD